MPNASGEALIVYNPAVCALVFQPCYADDADSTGAILLANSTAIQRSLKCFTNREILLSAHEKTRHQMVFATGLNPG